MRKIAVAIAIVGALAASTAPADAQYHNRHHGGGGHHHHRGGGGGWIAPLIGGLVLGGAIYGLSQPGYAAPPTYYAPAPQFRTECQMVPVYDRHGYFRGERRECYQVPNY
jgi:hypothetical protein